MKGYLSIINEYLPQIEEKEAAAEQARDGFLEQFRPASEA